MGTRLGKLGSAVANLEKVLNELNDKGTINDPQTAHVQKLEQIATKRWDSVDDRLEELEDDDENFKDKTQHLRVCWQGT